VLTDADIGMSVRHMTLSARNCMLLSNRYVCHSTV